MKEIWKDIEGYEGRYQVSNLGRVKSLAREYKTGANQATIRMGEKVMKQKVRPNKYCLVTLRRDGVVCDAYVHRLVAEAFIPNPTNRPQVNHRDENPSNNKVDNLEWCTPLENVRYGTGIARSVSKRCKPVVQKTLDGEIVKIWDSIAEAGDSFIPIQGRKNICNALSQPDKKTAYGFYWNYYETDTEKKVQGEGVHHRRLVRKRKEVL